MPDIRLRPAGLPGDVALVAGEQPSVDVTLSAWPVVTLAPGARHGDAVAAPVGPSTIELTPAPVATTLAVPAPTLAVAASDTTLAPAPVATILAVPAPVLALSLALAPAPVATTPAVPTPTLGQILALTPSPVPTTPAVPGPTLALSLVLSPAPVPATLGVPPPALSIAAADIYLSPDPVAVWLGVPPIALSTSGGTVPRDDKPPASPRKPLPQQRSVVAVSLFTDLITRYGATEGRRIYFEMESKRQGPFGTGNKYDASKRGIKRGRGSGRRAPTVHVNIPDARKS